MNTKRRSIASGVREDEPSFEKAAFTSRGEPPAIFTERHRVLHKSRRATIHDRPARVGMNRIKVSGAGMEACSARVG